MRVYIKNYKRVLVAVALMICISLLGNITKSSVNQMYREFCEEDLIDIIEPMGEDERTT